MEKEKTENKHTPTHECHCWIDHGEQGDEENIVRCPKCCEAVNSFERNKAVIAELVEAAKLAFHWSVIRSESKRKWSVDDQQAHEKLKAAITRASQNHG